MEVHDFITDLLTQLLHKKSDLTPVPSCPKKQLYGI